VRVERHGAGWLDGLALVLAGGRRHDETAPRGGGRAPAVVGEQVLARVGHERGEALQEDERLEDEVSGVSPGPPKADRNAPVGRCEGDPSRQGWRSSRRTRPRSSMESRSLERADV